MIIYFRTAPVQVRAFQGHHNGVSSFVIYSKNLLSAGGNRIGLSSLSQPLIQVILSHIDTLMLANEVDCIFGLIVFMHFQLFFYRDKICRASTAINFSQQIYQTWTSPALRRSMCFPSPGFSLLQLMMVFWGCADEDWMKYRSK